MRILVAVPTYETIYPDTYKSIWDMDKAGHEVLFEYIRGYDVSTARNKSVNKALELEADYILMVDNDVVIPKETLNWMLEDAKDVCLGHYAHRNQDNIYNGNSNICRLYDQHGKKYFDYTLDSEYTAGDMEQFRTEGQTKIKIHGGGMGCAFIKTDIFSRLKYPWYKWANYPDKKRTSISEDLFFCELCRKAGIPIYADVRVSCGHLMRYVQWME